MPTGASSAPASALPGLDDAGAFKRDRTAVEGWGESLPRA